MPTVRHAENKCRKVGEDEMKCFPLDCTTECPHYKTWDLSIDDWTSVCDILKVQVDDCDGDIIRYRCPLDTDKRYTNTIKTAVDNHIPLRW